MLIDARRARLGDPGAPSFRLMGEDLQLLTVDELHAAAAQEAAIPAVLRDELLGEERALAAEAYGWLCRYNRSMHARVAGYLELGRRCAFRYPWPIVAILGIRRGKLEFKSFRLPPAFDLRDHELRVEAFAHAFVTPVTGSPSDYRIARDWVIARFG